MPKIKLGTKYFEPSLIAVFEPVDKKHCKIWMQGASAIDGAFLVPVSADEVIVALQEAHFMEIAQDLARDVPMEERDDRLAQMHGG